MIRPLGEQASKAVALSTHRLNLYVGSVRSAKTVSSIVAWLRHMATHPRVGNDCIAGNSIEAIERNVLSVITEMIGDGLDYRNGVARIFGHPVWLFGIANRLAVGRLKGFTARTAYVDEVAEAEEEAFRMLTTRLSVPGAQLFGSTNPLDRGHWLEKDWLRRAAVHLDVDGKVHELGGDLDLFYAEMLPRHNPYLSEAFVDALAKEQTGKWRQRYVDGVWSGSSSDWPKVSDEPVAGPLSDLGSVADLRW